MSFQDAQTAGEVKRGPGRPRRDEGQAAVAKPPAPSGPARSAPKYDPDKDYWVTLQEIEGVKQGPQPLYVGGEKEYRATLLPGRRVKIKGVLLNESVERAVVDHRGPDFAANEAAAERGEDTIKAPRMTGTVTKRFHVEVEEA